MAEAAKYEKINIGPELEQLRLLTEVDHLTNSMDDNGDIPLNVLSDVEINLQTAVYEIAMPYAVSVTHHQVEYLSRSQRIIKWLGRSIVQNAMNGRLFHKSEEAHKRVDVEIAEANHTQETLRPGIAQVFISPKMSEHDAPRYVAESEHLHDDDSVRVSYAVTNSRGELVARRLESLLVSDIPLSAWVAILKDPNNIFAKTINVADELSAVAVMEVFRELELSEAAIPDGPVSLVEAVLPYIKDKLSYSSVSHQLECFRKDQLKYKLQAEKTAREWLTFERELAYSIKTGSATFAIKRCINTLSSHWNEEDLGVISNHQLDSGEYKMSRQLAATLERAKQYLLNSFAAIAIGNENVVGQMDGVTARIIQKNITELANMPIGPEFYQRQAQIDRMLAGQNLEIGRGCPGKLDVSFNGRNENDESSQADMLDKEKIKWKQGICRISACISPRPTKVGPCSICERCQEKYDRGEDPAKIGLVSYVLEELRSIKQQKKLSLKEAA